jgi:hypothetical protein
MTTMSKTCVIPHETMNSANIQKTARNGTSARRRMNHTRMNGIEKYAMAISASDAMCTASAGHCHKKHIPCGMKPPISMGRRFFYPPCSAS